MLAFNANQLLSEVESLPLDIKTKLIEKLLSSLNPTEKSIDHLWKEEIDLRIKSIESREVELVSGEKVFRKIKDRFAKWTLVFIQKPKENSLMQLSKNQDIGKNENKSNNEWILQRYRKVIYCEKTCWLINAGYDEKVFESCTKALKIKQ